jgi:hypothetical protein
VNSLLGKVLSRTLWAKAPSVMCMLRKALQTPRMTRVFWQLRSSKLTVPKIERRCLQRLACSPATWLLGRTRIGEKLKLLHSKQKLRVSKYWLLKMRGQELLSAVAIQELQLQQPTELQHP